jgi:hypothetical protein
MPVRSIHSSTATFAQTVSAGSVTFGLRWRATALPPAPKSSSHSLATPRHAWGRRSRLRNQITASINCACIAATRRRGARAPAPRTRMRVPFVDCGGSFAPADEPPPCHQPIDRPAAASHDCSRPPARFLSDCGGEPPLCHQRLSHRATASQGSEHHPPPAAAGRCGQHRPGSFVC